MRSVRPSRTSWDSKIIERSIDHLETVEARFEDELQDAASSELKSLMETRSELRSTKEDHEQALESAEETRDTLISEIGEIKRKLEQIDDSAGLEEDRTQLENELQQVETRIEEINDEIEDTISTKGHLPFAMPAVEATAKDLDKLRDQGAIPSEVSNQFVDRLLDDEECICGRPLEPGTEAYTSVASYKSEAVTEGFDQAAIRIISHLTQLDSERDDYFETIDELLQQRSELRDSEQEIAEELERDQCETRKDRCRRPRNRRDASRVRIGPREEKPTNSRTQKQTLCATRSKSRNLTQTSRRSTHRSTTHAKTKRG